MAGHYTVRVSTRAFGPLFTGMAGEAIDDWANAVGEELANQAQDEIRRRALLMHRSARPVRMKVGDKRVTYRASHPGRVNTGAAARAVRVRRTTTSDWKVVGESYEGEVWWPWLEGTSKRNLTTRFKGYHTFRIVKTVIQRRTRRVGEEILRRYLPDMGGS